MDDALARTGAARGQRDALPTAVAFDHITTALYYPEQSNQEARVGQIYFDDQAGKWVRFESALTTSIESATPATSPWLSLVRHVVGLALAAMAFELAVYRSNFDVLRWAAVVLITWTVGLAVSSLSSLYLTAKSRGRFLLHATYVAWLAFFLSCLGTYQSIWGKEAPKVERGLAQQKGRDLPPPVPNSKLVQLRALPDYAGQSDESIVLQLHRENPDLSLEFISGELGVPLSPSLRQAAASDRGSR